MLSNVSPLSEITAMPDPGSSSGRRSRKSEYEHTNSHLQDRRHSISFTTRKASQNTFSVEFEPIALYRLNDWILFEGTINAVLPVGSKADFELPVATAQIFLNDYLEINAGIFDQPFGDWLE